MTYQEKAVVKIDSDGNLMQCAKGLDASACGFVPGAKVCGKCGAMPVAMKMVPVDMEDDEEEMPAYKGRKRNMYNGMKANGMEDDEEMMMEDEEEDLPMPVKKPMRKKPMPMAEDDEEMMDDEDMMDEEETDDEEMAAGKGWGMSASSDMRNNRRRRLQSMGIKSAEISKSGYLCAIDRKVYPGGSMVCDDCPGGCVAEKGMPGLLEVEGAVETMFKGYVIDSGYSQDADMFVVDVDVKGKALEAFIDGTTGELLGFHKLDDSVMQQKSLDPIEFIGYSEAADIAVKSFPGEVVSVEPDVFEGFDCYAVEIDGMDGKSYDVFIALDGERLGQDIYETDDVADIEAEAAEIALKRAFPEADRMSMAKRGFALPDGSFPIENTGDLRNAIQAFGRAKDKEAAKRHIMKRARDLNADDMIPANWVSGEKTARQIDDPDFLRSLIEFEILSTETDETPEIN